MALFADPLVAGWKAENVVWEVALKEGYALTSRIDAVAECAGSPVWRVCDAERGQAFLICLSDRLDAGAVDALALTKDDVFVCRDSALDDDLAANLALQCNLKTI